MNIEDDFESGTWKYLDGMDGVEEEDVFMRQPVEQVVSTTKIVTTFHSEPSRPSDSMAFGTAHPFSSSIYEDDAISVDDFPGPGPSNVYVIDDEDGTSPRASVFSKSTTPVPSLSRSLELLQERIHVMQETYTQATLAKANRQKVRLELLEELRVANEELDNATSRLAALET